MSAFRESRNLPSENGGSFHEFESTLERPRNMKEY